MPALTQKQIDALIAETRAIETREGVPVEEAFVRAWLRSMVRPIVSAWRRRSLSPALEGDLAAFGGAPHFARAVERVGEVEQGGAALPFARGDQFLPPPAQGVGFEGIGRAAGAVRAFGFHAAKLRAWVALRQCDRVAVLHPENVQ